MSAPLSRAQARTLSIARSILRHVRTQFDTRRAVAPASPIAAAAIDTAGTGALVRDVTPFTRAIMDDFRAGASADRTRARVLRAAGADIAA
jgi:hypothetical protein